MSLYELVANDPRIKQLICKLEHSSHKNITRSSFVAEMPGIVGIAGFGKEGNIESYFLPREQNETTDEVEKRIKEVTKDLQRPFVVYSNNLDPTKTDYREHYYCFMDLDDHMPESDKGKWVVEGIRENGEAHRLPLMTLEDVKKLGNGIFQFFRQEVLVHEAGKHTYTILRGAARVADAEGNTATVYSKRGIEEVPIAS